MSKRTRRRSSTRTAPTVRWGCTAHQTPLGETCRWCQAQGVLFARKQAVRRKTQ